MEEQKQEGTLTLDVYFKDNELVIVSPIAGASLENIEILVEGDVLMIKGTRMPPENIDPSLYEHQECFWGPFSRTVVLPKDLDIDNVRAYYHNGVLMIKIPKKEETKARRIEIKSDI
jgi:HSP20 family protein